MDSEVLNKCWRKVRIVLFLYLSIFARRCSSASTETCDRSVATSGSGADIMVCVRAWSSTALEVTWSPDSGSRSSDLDLGQIKNWVLSVAASQDRRRVISFLSLESSVSRHIVRSLSPNTEYFVFLESVDLNDWYLTMTSRPLAVRTLAIGESRTSPVVKTTTPAKQTETYGGQERVGQGRGGSGEREKTSPPDATHKEGRRKENVSTTETAKEATDQRRRGRERKQTTNPNSVRKTGDSKQSGRTEFQTTKKPIKTSESSVESYRTRKPYEGSGSRRTRESTVEEQKTRQEKVSERRENLNRRTLEPYVPIRLNTVSFSKNLASTTTRSYSENFRSKKTSALPNTRTTVSTTFQPFKDTSMNTSGLNLGNATNQSESRKRGDDAGSRMLWWVLVGCGAGGGLFLVLVLLTLLTKRRKRKCSSFRCPHLEQELSQTSRSSTKLNNVITDDTAKQDKANKVTCSELRNASDNGYTRSPSVSQGRPLPPIMVSTLRDSEQSACRTTASGNITIASYLGQICSGNGAFVDEGREESVYATVGDNLLAPDPARVISIISWGSEFDILEEPKMDVYGNLSSSKSLEKVYGNIDLTYGNMTSSASVVKASQSQPPPPATMLPKLTTAKNAPLNPAEVQSPHPYAVPRRQTSTSSVPNFVAPPPPAVTATSATVTPELLAQLQTLPQLLPPVLQQQHQQQERLALLPGLDLPKEKLQQLVMLLLSSSSETASVGDPATSPGQSNSNAGITEEATSPSYLVPESPFFRKA